ncbi:MAG: type II secretion system protein [Verrucomicrobiales bacterium]|nr:type II secretion system protein [Verrucomicrobiales bacterium]
MDEEEDNHWLNRWGIPLVVILLVGILVASVVIPMQNGVSERAPVTIAYNNVKQLLLGCRAYAADNEGKYPANLKILYPYYIDHLPLFEGQDVKSGKKSPMIYFSGLTDTSPSRSPLIEHPFTFKGKKVIGFAGGHVTMEKVKP